MSFDHDWEYYIHSNLTKSYLRPKKMRSLIPDFPGRWWFHYSLIDMYGDGLFRGDYSDTQCGVWLAPGIRYGANSVNFKRFSFIPRDANGKVLHTSNTAEYIRALVRGVYTEASTMDAQNPVCHIVSDGLIASDHQLRKRVGHDSMDILYERVSTQALLVLQRYCDWYLSWVARREPVMVCAEGENSPHVEIVGKNGKTKRIEGAYPL